MSIENRSTLIAFKSIRRISGKSVTVQRGVASGTVVAVPGDTIMERSDEDGQTIRVKVRDYLILRSDFEAIVGAGEKPKRGDEIVEVVADYSRTFEAAEFAGECFRWWDKGGQVLRIHTIETDMVTTTTAGA